MSDLRCPQCNKLLAKGFEGKRIALYCRACKISVAIEYRVLAVGPLTTSAP